MKKHATLLILSLLAVMTVVFIAYAAVTFDPASGTGFVGKGDVQLAFGWNNATMQRNHTGITFVYEQTSEYSFECEWYTGPTRNRTYHRNSKTEEFSVNASIPSDSRRTGQWTGWNLNGWNDSAPSGSAPNITNADCGSEGNEMKTLVEGSVELVSSSGGLYAVHNGDRRLLQ